jgi:hypothetical protein
MGSFDYFAPTRPGGQTAILTGMDSFGDFAPTVTRQTHVEFPIEWMHTVFPALMDS